jgi:hypothetical protein
MTVRSHPHLYADHIRLFCEFLRESLEVREKREYLKQRKRRSALAKLELTEFGFWTPSQ